MVSKRLQCAPISVYFRGKKSPQALIACINGPMPMIFITRFKLWFNLVDRLALMHIVLCVLIWHNTLQKNGVREISRTPIKKRATLNRGAYT